jgi:hypothetical protein
MENLKRIIRKVLSESDYTVEPELGTFPREKEVKSIFGQKYGPYIPVDVLRYLRKNPAMIFKRLYELYGEKSFEYLNNAKGNNSITESKEDMSSRYMFFSNLQQMRRQCDLLLDLDESMVEEILENGHDWAQDHISEAKNNMDQVFDFLMNETKSGEMMEDDDNIINDLAMTEKDPNMALAMYQMNEGRKKVGTKLCARGLASAKAKYDVFPSAYSNGHAVQVCKGKIKGLDGKRHCSGAYC